MDSQQQIPDMTTPDTNSQSLLQVMLFTDIVGSTDMKKRLGDSRAAEIVGAHDALFRRCLSAHQGVERDHAGDGFFATFARPSDALRCALAFQCELAAAPPDNRLSVRIGINMGEIVRITDGGTGDGHDKFVGLAIDTAARVMSLALGGQILMTRGAFDSSRQQIQAAPNGSPVRWLAHGTYLFKGIDDPLDVYEAGVEGTSPLRPPVDTEKAGRSVALGDEATLGWRPGQGLEIPFRPNWILQRNLGEGGFGEVWLAEQKKTKERRVFKFCFQADRLRGLKREVVLFRLLKDSLGERSDIARIYDWQFDEAPFFIEAEYTEGGSFVEWAEKKGGMTSIPLATRITLVAETAEALAAAHGVGVLHKDIKPANILITTGRDGQPHSRLTDFGIGLITDRDMLDQRGISSIGFSVSVTSGSTSSASGTQMYMAPEILEGKLSTTLSDVYALGVMLYQVVCGDLSRALASGWERDIDDDLLREDIAACVDGRPERRLSGAADLARRLRTLNERRTERETRQREHDAAVMAVAIAQQARRRRNIFAVVSILGIAFTVGVGVFALRESRRASEESGLRLAAETAQRNAETARADAEKFRQEAEYEQYIALIQFADSCIREKRIESALDSLFNTPEQFRDWEWGYLMNKTSPQSAPKMWSYNEGEKFTFMESDRFQTSITLPAFSPSGDQVAFGANAGDVLVVNSATGAISSKLAADKSVVYSVSFSPDGKTLATAGSDGLRIWDLSTGDFRKLEGHTKKVLGVVFFANGTRLFSASYDRTAIIWDAQSLQPLFNLECPTRVACVAAASAADVVAAGMMDGEVIVWNGSDGKKIFANETHTEQVHGIALTPDGKFLLCAYADGLAEIYDVETGKSLHVLKGHARPVYSISLVSPSRIATTSDDKTIKIWDLHKGRELLTLKENAYPIYQAAAHQASRTIASGSEDGAIKIWEALPWKMEELPGASSLEARDRFALLLAEQGRSWDPLPTQNETPALFTEGFDSADSLSRWTFVDNWKWVNGRVRCELDPKMPNRVAEFEAGFYDLDHYAFEADVELPQDSRFTILVRFREKGAAIRQLRSYTAVGLTSNKLNVQRTGYANYITDGTELGWSQLPVDLLAMPPFAEKLTWTPKPSFRIRIEARGPIFTVFIDGKFVSQFESAEHATGSFGFGHYLGDDVPGAYYDNVAVYRLPAPD